MADLTPGEKAALFLQLGEKIVELVKESGLLKPKRRKRVVKRKARKAKAAEQMNGAAKPKAQKAKPAKASKPAPEPSTESAYDPDED